MRLTIGWYLKLESITKLIENQLTLSVSENIEVTEKDCEYILVLLDIENVLWFGITYNLSSQSRIQFFTKGYMTLYYTFGADNINVLKSSRKIKFLQSENINILPDVSKTQKDSQTGTHKYTENKQPQTKQK